MTGFQGEFNHIQVMSADDEILEDLERRGIRKPKSATRSSAQDRAFFLAVLRHPRAVKLTWEKWLSDSDVEQEEKEILVQGLTRLTMGDGPDKTYGYCGTVNNLIDRVCGELEIDSKGLCSIIFKLERFGFRFQDTTSLLLFARKARALLKDFEGPERPNNRSVHGEKVDSIIHFIVGLSSDGVKAGDNVEDIHLSEEHGDYNLLILAMEAFLEIPGLVSLIDQVVIEDEEYTLNTTWTLLCRSVELGLNEEKVKRALARVSGPWGIHFLSMFVQSGGSRSLFNMCMKEPDLLLNSGDIISLAENWWRAGMPCEPLKFAEMGGTVELWQAHEGAVKLRSTVEQSRKAPAVGVSVVTPKPDQTPKGTKRRHANFRAPKEEPTVIDFGAICAELDVSTVFPDLDEALVRAVLVHGLLREGTRLAPPSALPRRDDRKLWKQVKDHVPQTSRRQLTRALQPLQKAHLITYQGGDYQLAKPNARFPKALALLTQLKATVARHTN